MKKTTFNINNKSNNTFRTNNTKSLDDLILAGVIKNNKYLFDTTPRIKTSTIRINNIAGGYIDDLYRAAVSDKHNTIGFGGIYDSILKDNKFINAAKFLANYKSNKTHKYALNTLYYTNDGTPVTFYDDEIQIGYDIYKYDRFGDIDFLNELTPSVKKIIINININL